MKHYKFDNGKFYMTEGHKSFCGIDYDPWEEFIPEEVHVVNKIINRSDIYAYYQIYLICGTIAFCIKYNGEYIEFNQEFEIEIPIIDWPDGGIHNAGYDRYYKNTDGEKNYFKVCMLLKLDNEDVVNGVEYSLYRCNEGLTCVGTYKETEYWDNKIVSHNIFTQKVSTDVLEAKKILEPMINSADIPDDVKTFAIGVIDKIPEQIELYYKEVERIKQYYEYKDMLWKNLRAIKKEVVNDLSLKAYEIYTKYTNRIDRISPTICDA